MKASQLAQSGKFVQAEKIAKTARKKDPENIALMNLLSAIYMSTNRHGLAEELMKIVHKRSEPKSASFYVNYAVTLRVLRKYKNALELIKEGLNQTPNSLDLIIEKGCSLRKLGEWEPAREALNQAIKLAPNCRAWTVLGNLELDVRNHETSLSIFQAEIDKGQVTQNNIVGLIRSLYALEKYSLCVESYLKFHQDLAANYNNELFMYAFNAIHQIEKEKAQPYLVELLKLRQGFSDDLIELHTKLMAPIFFNSEAEISEFRQEYLEILNSSQRFDKHFNTEYFKPKNHLYLAYHGENDLEINTSLAKLLPSHGSENDAPVKKKDSEKQKIVVVSEHFFPGHVIHRLFNEIFARLPASAFEVEIFYIKKDSEWNLSSGEVKKLNLVSGKTNAFKYTNLKKVLNELAKSAPDIIFFPEVGEGAVTYSIASQRIAKIQMTSWGFPQTTGLPTIDYFVTSKHIEPENCEEHYSEQLIQLNHLPCFYERVEALVATDLPAEIDERLGNNPYIACLQSLFKIHPDFDNVIKSILDKNPNIKIVMLDQFGKSFISNRLTKIGVNVNEQIVFLPKMERDVFLKVLNDAIVALDPLYFGSGNTMYESFSLGLPIVTMPGKFMRGRAVYGAYQQMGISDLIANSPEDYVNLVTKLVGDDKLREKMRDKINSHSHQLFSAADVIDEFSELFLSISK